jgi:hypothetical protein
MEWPGVPSYISIPQFPNPPYKAISIIRQCEKKNYSTQLTYRDVELDLSFLHAFWKGNGSVCFPGDDNPDGTYTGTLAIAEDRIKGLCVVFLFSAKDMKGVDTQYRLFLFNGNIVDQYSGYVSTDGVVPCDDLEEPRWPPYDGGDVTIIEFLEWETFVLGNKSKKCVGSLNLPPVYFIVTNYGPVPEPTQ